MGTMGTAGTRWLLGLLLMGTPGLAAGFLAEPQLCYVLDAVLFLYSLILTGLYIRLRFAARRWRGEAEKQKEEEALYAGLSSGHQETYETLEMKDSCPPNVPPMSPRVPQCPQPPRTPPVSPS